MRKIYLIRHGEPQLPGGERICLSRTDVPLSAEGHRQGARLAEHFAGIKLEAVFSSDLTRAKETASYLSAQATAISGLQELGVGDWEGLAFHEIRERYPELYARRGEDPVAHMMPGGERPSDCRDRGLAVLRDLLAKTAGDIAVVAHAGINRLVLCELLGRDIKEFLSVPQPYGCINILQEHDGMITVLVVGEVPAELRYL